MKLQVLIATHGPDGIQRLASTPPSVVDEVGYLITWQQSGTTAIPAALVRPDIKIHRVHSTGLSNNRNEALKRSTAPLLLIADDDLTFYPEALTSLIAAFEARPGVEVITGRYDGEDNRQYPPCEYDLSRPRHHVTSFEMALRRRVIERGVRFDPRFGLGAPRYEAAEEEFFLLDALRAGMQCRFIPLTICRHQGSTTMFRTLTPGALRAQGVHVRATRPATALLRLPLIAWRHHRAGRSPLLAALWHLLQGWSNPRKPL